MDEGRSALLRLRAYARKTRTKHEGVSLFSAAANIVAKRPSELILAREVTSLASFYGRSRW